MYWWCRQKEYKMKNLQTEIDRIMAKERNEGGLTSGQASTMARNEQVLTETDTLGAAAGHRTTMTDMPISASVFPRFCTTLMPCDDPSCRP
jgi:hypothetical protein